MRNWSPEKTWANGMLDLRNRNLHQVMEFQDDIRTLTELEFSKGFVVINSTILFIF